MPKSKSLGGSWWSLQKAEFDALPQVPMAPADDETQCDRDPSIAGPKQLWLETTLRVRFGESWCETETYSY